MGRAKSRKRSRMVQGRADIRDEVSGVESSLRFDISQREPRLSAKKSAAYHGMRHEIDIAV